MHLFGRRFLVFDFVESVEAGAGFSGAGFDSGADPLEFFFEKFLALFLGILRDVLADCFGLKKGRVIPGVGIGLAVVDFDDAGGDDVEKVAVVRDEDDRAAVVFEEAFQPADGIGVEVVGWLVEEKEIRLGGKSAAKSNTAFLSTGERAGFGFERGSAQCVGE